MTATMACATLRVGMKVLINSSFFLKKNERWGIVHEIHQHKDGVNAIVFIPNYVYYYRRPDFMVKTSYSVFWLEYPETPRDQWTSKVRLGG